MPPAECARTATLFSPTRSSPGCRAYDRNAMQPDIDPTPIPLTKVVSSQATTPSASAGGVGAAENIWRVSAVSVKLRRYHPVALTPTYLCVWCVCGVCVVCVWCVVWPGETMGADKGERCVRERGGG